MKISEMTDILKRAPFPLRVALDKMGEKDPVLKKHVVAVDYAITTGMSDRAIRVLIEELLDHVEQKYFVDRGRTRAKIVLFLADQTKKK